MRFNQFTLLLLLFAYTQLSAQTTYFIKYKENVSFSSIEQKVQQDQFVPQGMTFSSANLMLDQLIFSLKE